MSELFPNSILDKWGEGDKKDETGMTILMTILKKNGYLARSIWIQKNLFLR